MVARLMKRNLLEQFGEKLQVWFKSVVFIKAICIKASFCFITRRVNAEEQTRKTVIRSTFWKSKALRHLGTFSTKWSGWDREHSFGGSLAITFLLAVTVSGYTSPFLVLSKKSTHIVQRQLPRDTIFQWLCPDPLLSASVVTLGFGVRFFLLPQERVSKPWLLWAVGLKWAKDPPPEIKSLLWTAKWTFVFCFLGRHFCRQ